MSFITMFSLPIRNLQNNALRFAALKIGVSPVHTRRTHLFFFDINVEHIFHIRKQNVVIL